MSVPHDAPMRPFPLWLLAAGFLFACGYWPTLSAPFDFLDDGNLVYPALGLTGRGHVELWWEKVAANVEHLGPFRPVAWAHWQLQANLFGADPVAWRFARLLWCGLAGTMLLALLRELKTHPIAASIATAAAMWNPYRNEIWTSLTLAEGVAMPYAMLALWAARRACTSPRAWRFDILAITGLLMALGCKNVFIAMLPAMLALRLWPEGRTWGESIRAHRVALVAYLLPVLLPLGHFFYFQTHWHPGQYETPGPSWGQAKQFTLWLKGAAGMDFLGVGLALTAIPTLVHRKGFARNAPASACAALLLLGGFFVYLPLHIMCGRYTMPAVWGLDIAFALLLTGFAGIPVSAWTRAGWLGVAGGLAAMMVASVGRQEKLATRSRMLWAVLHHVEETVPFGSRVAWIGGDSERGELNAEEGIHLYWHLLHRGRGDVRLGLRDIFDRPLARVELAPMTQEPEYRIASRPLDGSLLWQPERTFDFPYRFGRRRYQCSLESQRPLPDSGLIVDPLTARFMQDVFENPGNQGDALKRLLPAPEHTAPTTAGLLESTANKPR